MSFPVVDEVSRHGWDDAEPDTVHFEVRLPGTPDPDRLRRAVAQALRCHPRALVREVPGPWYRRRYRWELVDAPEAGVVVFPAPEPDALERARTRCLTTAPPLSTAPPLRLEVVADPGRPGGSVLFLTVHHTALDGPSALRVLATAAERYGGGPVAPPPAARVRLPAGPGAARPDAVEPPPGPAPWARPARLAPGTPARTGPPMRTGGQGRGLDRDQSRGRVPGNGLLVLDLPVPSRPAGAPYTVNDQLLVATALTVTDWNRSRGRRPRPVRITMPVDDRPLGPGMPLGNGTRLAEVPFTVDELTSATTGGEGERDACVRESLRRTAARTRALKAVRRPPLGTGAELLTAPVLPVAWRGVLVRGLRRALAPWMSTTLVSNLGRIPYPLDFGDAGRAEALWMSAPARTPRGLTVTAASTGGRLHVSLRWCTALFDDADGDRLRELFVRNLDATRAGDGRAGNERGGRT
ncbi:condensation protein [Streptomyces sp. JNUCC 64]